MRVFVSGASGWIGSAVVTELLSEGHEVLGLARSDAAAEKVAASGAEVPRGDVQDLDVLRAGAERADGVVHLAFRHDVGFAGDFDIAIASNQAAIETLGGALAGSGRPFAIASGIPVEPGQLATERVMPEPSPGAGGRFLNERTALAFAERGVRSMALRFAPTVHGAGDNGFVPRPRHPVRAARGSKGDVAAWRRGGVVCSRSRRSVSSGPPASSGGASVTGAGGRSRPVWWRRSARTRPCGTDRCARRRR